MPKVIKRDQTREPFNEDKLAAGLTRALEKRPVSTEAIDQTMGKIKSELRATGEREVTSQFIGEIIMQALKELDKVAYVRFASVYRSFEDVKEFGEEIARLSSE